MSTNLSYEIKLNSKNVRLVYANDIVILGDTKNEIVVTKKTKNLVL